MKSQADSDRLHRQLDMLPTLPRAVFLLHRIDDLDYSQIGFRLGIGIKVVERHFAEAIYVLTFGPESDAENEDP
jgi:DNA-directed RNA polymerase specialized sigma24 family protein